MLDQYPYPEYEGRRNIVTGIILAVITCGLYSLYWQYKQMETLTLGLEERIILSSYGFCFHFSHVVFSDYIMNIRWRQVSMKFRLTKACM